MLATSLFALAALSGFAITAPTSGCTAEQRLYYSNQVIVAYAATTPSLTYTTFNNIPFGVPDLNGPCETVILPDGGPPVPVGVTGNGVVTFGTATRQAFSKVTGQYVDFPQNGTTLINTNVTLGIRSGIPIPITFRGYVFLDFTADCRISAVRAYAKIPTEILGLAINLSGGLPYIPLPI